MIKLLLLFLKFPPEVLAKLSSIQKNINDFLKGKIERDVPPSVLSCEKLYDVVLRQSMKCKKKKLEELMAKYEAYFSNHNLPPCGPPLDFPPPPPPPATRACDWFLHFIQFVQFKLVIWCCLIDLWNCFISF